MIVSVHIPKTAGTSFNGDLGHVFGARLLADYEDWPEIPTPEAAVHNERNRAAVVAGAESIGERYDAIYGHFVAGKYAGVFPLTALVTMVRDPYQHAVSTYEHAMPVAASPHPGHRLITERRMTLLEFIEAFPNHQALYVGEMPLEDFAMIGVTERYEQSVALFEAVFGISMPRTTIRQNTNPAKRGREYEITPEVRRAVERFRAEDIRLYRQAGERLTKLCSAYGV
jgi:hypothetical protein